SSGKLQRVDGFGHVRVQTPTEVVTGDKGVYVPDTGIARIVGSVHITRGENVLNGAAAIVNMHTGLATLSQNPGARVEGLIVPSGPGAGPGAPGGKPAAKPARPGVPSAAAAPPPAAILAGATPPAGATPLAGATP
ncbi:MAG: LptA/OstA family protein, partial [Janthinobacterium lividum]